MSNIENFPGEAPKEMPLETLSLERLTALRTDLEERINNLNAIVGIRDMYHPDDNRILEDLKVQLKEVVALINRNQQASR